MLVNGVDQHGIAFGCPGGTVNGRIQCVCPAFGTFYHAWHKTSASRRRHRNVLTIAVTRADNTGDQTPSRPVAVNGLDEPLVLIWRPTALDDVASHLGEPALSAVLVGAVWNVLGNGMPFRGILGVWIL